MSTEPHADVAAHPHNRVAYVLERSLQGRAPENRSDSQEKKRFETIYVGWSLMRS